MVSDASGGHRLVRLAGLRIHIQLFAPRVVPGLLSLFVCCLLLMVSCVQGTPLYERVRGRWFRVRGGALSCEVGVRSYELRVTSYELRADPATPEAC